MNDPNTSAQDPIFYLHHANIDRLWKRWLAQGGGRLDLTGDQVWMNTMFTFFDENGQQVQKSGKDILDTVGQLNYCYDDEPGCCPQCCKQLCDNKDSACRHICAVDFELCPSEIPHSTAERCLKMFKICEKRCKDQKAQCVARCG